MNGRVGYYGTTMAYMQCFNALLVHPRNFLGTIFIVDATSIGHSVLQFLFVITICFVQCSKEHTDTDIDNLFFT